MYCREAWIAACNFQNLSDREVLEEVCRRVVCLSNPVVLLDLDSTLYEVLPRTFQILKEWAQLSEAASFPGVQMSLLKMQPDQIGYSVSDTFRNMGLFNQQDAQKCLMDFWVKRFFTSEYLKYDRPYLGAVEFAARLHSLGAVIVYLTGRDEPGMGAGTREILLRDGFPWQVPRTHLLMKSSFQEDDLRHKLKAAPQYVAGCGTLVASFENEPPNVVALSKIFPDAMHVFMDSVCSDQAAPVGDGLFRIRSYLYS